MEFELWIFGGIRNFQNSPVSHGLWYNIYEGIVYFFSSSISKAKLFRPHVLWQK